jgi:hypothetical protein
VNHEVEDHVHIERARREDGEPVGLKEHGPLEVRLHSENGGIEAFQVADLQDSVLQFGAANQVVRFVQAGGDRFFNQDVQAGIEELCCDGMVLHGWHGDGNGVEFEPCGKKLLG